MDFEPGFLLLLLWGLLALIGNVAKKKGGGARQPGSRQTRVPPATSPGTARRKPQTFDDLLAEMRDQLDEAKRAEAREAARRAGSLPGAEEVEERESLEIEPVVVSLEGPARIEEREIVNSDLEAQRLIAARLRDAEQRNRAWRLADHKAFDARIRAPKPKPRLPAKQATDLKRAVIWREVLGKPVSLRD